MISVNLGSSPVTDDYWFRYDAMNRLVTDKGILSGGAIVRGTGGLGLGLAYDAAGQRVGALRTVYTAPSVTGYFDPYTWTWVGTGYTSGSYYETRENYAYDGAGRIAPPRMRSLWPRPSQAGTSSGRSPKTPDRAEA